MIRRLGVAPDHLAPYVLADTIAAQMFSAFSYWALCTDDVSPADTLHAAVRALTELLTPT